MGVCIFTQFIWNVEVLSVFSFPVCLWADILPQYKFKHPTTNLQFQVFEGVERAEVLDRKMGA